MIEELNGDFLQWLRGFYYVAKTGSVRKAAQMMRRNPSTISYQLKCLEEELKVVLFDRMKRSLQITEEGKKLFAWTISTFETLQSMRSSVSNADGRLKGSIRMSTTLPAAALAVPAIVKFTRLNPLVELKIERGLSRDILRKVEDSEVDFGLLPVIRKPEEGKLDIIIKARPLLVFANENSWHIPPVPSLDDLKRLPYVTFSDSHGLLDDLGTVAGNIGGGDFMLKNAVIRANNYHLIMRFVWHGLGATIMDELCFQATRFGAQWEKLSYIALDHLLPNRLYGILTRRHRRLSPQTLELIKCLRTHFLGLPAFDSQEAWLAMRQQGKILEDSGAQGYGDSCAD